MSLSNYPDGLSDYTPGTPWNEPEVPEQEFNVTCVQILSKETTVITNNYIPGASGVDYEPDDEGGYSACGWHDPDDTSDTNWSDEYRKNDHYTPHQLIQMLKIRVEKELKELELSPIDSRHPYTKAADVRRLKHLIEECDGWCDDETSVIEC